MHRIRAFLEVYVDDGGQQLVDALLVRHIRIELAPDEQYGFEEFQDRFLLEECELLVGPLHIFLYLLLEELVTLGLLLLLLLDGALHERVARDRQRCDCRAAGAAQLDARPCLLLQLMESLPLRLQLLLLGIPLRLYLVDAEAESPNVEPASRIL